MTILLKLLAGGACVLLLAWALVLAWMVWVVFKGPGDSDESEW